MSALTYPAAQTLPRISFLRTSEPFEAALLHVNKFPAPAELCHSLGNFLLAWMRQLAKEHKLQPTAWIQASSLHEGDAADRLSANGAQWLPELGLGVWPDREPPRLWTKKDFYELNLGESLPSLMHLVFHISNGAEGAESALQQMAGSGTLMYALLSNSPQEFHCSMSQQHLPIIREEALRGYPFYMPLLDARSIEAGDKPSMLGRDSLLPTWLGSARFYLRESIEDGGILILSSLPGVLDRLRER